MRTLQRLIPVVGLALCAQHARAQEGGKIDPGVRGKVAIAAELKAAEWPISVDDERARRAPARVRRPTGQTEPRAGVEPQPELVVVLDGARPADLPPKKLAVQGHRFVPGQVLLAKPGPIALENKMSRRITIVDGQGRALVALEPGETKEAPLPAGATQLVVEEMPYARAVVNVLERARVLPVKDNGDVDFVAVEPGEYKLVFFHGAKPVYQQPFVLPEDKVFFVDATVSAKAVVTVAVKDATVRIAVPQGAPAPPP